MTDHYTGNSSKNGELVTTSRTDPAQAKSLLPKLSIRKRIQSIIWDTFDYPPEERRFVSKIDFFILYVTRRFKLSLSNKKIAHGLALHIFLRI